MTSKLFGVHDGHQSASKSVPVGSYRLWDVGVTWLDLETSPGVFDFTRLDQLVTEAETKNASVTLVLGRNPAFYAATWTECPPYTNFEDYVRKVMTQYRGRIDSYQVWNESNIATFWAGTQAQMAKLTDIVWRVRNEVDPFALVVAPSGPVRRKYQLTSYRQYLDSLDTSHIDAYAFSMYPLPDSVHGPEDFYELLGAVKDMLADYGQQDKPLWVAEINYGVGSSTYTSGLTDLLDARYQISNVMKTYILAKAAGVERCFWYRWDMPVWKGDAGQQQTIANTVLMKPWTAGSPPTDFSATPVGLAFARVQGWLSGRFVSLDVTTSGLYTVVLRKNGRRKYIYWNNNKGQHVKVPNCIRTTQAGKRTKVTDGNVWVTSQPVLIEPI